MSLTAAEVNQFEQEGWVMKRKVFSRGDMEPIQDALTEIVHREALALKDEGLLDEIHEDKPFDIRLACIRYDNVEACRVIYRSIMGKAGGGFSGESMFHFIRHRPLLSGIESLLGPDTHRRLNLSRASEVAGVGSRRSALASGFRLFHAALRQIPDINLLDPAGGCHARKRLPFCAARIAHTRRHTPLYRGTLGLSRGAGRLTRRGQTDTGRNGGG